MLYQATKNIYFAADDKTVLAGETVELTKERAEKANKELQLAFPDVEAVLVLVDEEEKPKKAGRKKAEVKAEEAIAE